MVVMVKGVRFEQLGPVDRRLSLERTERGRYLCPLCTYKFNGSFAAHWAMVHLRKEHYRCVECGWVGLQPGSHLAKNARHGGTPTMGGGHVTTVRIRDLMKPD